jgi:hypothetical protein
VAPVTLAAGGVAENSAQWLLKRMLRVDLDRKLGDAVASIKIHGEIPNSQLSRWRSLARSALAEPTAEKRLERVAILHAAEEKKKSAAWKKMQRARVRQGTAEQGRLTEWLKESVTRDDWLWKVLNKSQKPRLALGSLVSYEADRELEIEYRLRLIDGVLARHAHEQRGRK